MNKLIALILILLIAPVIGGVYGILHDQLTYTISEEYYTKFKFIQFGFENSGLGENIGTSKTPEIKMENPRIGVAIVGTLATWWVGLIIGIILGFIGLIQSSGRLMLKTTIRAILLAIIIALITGLLGWLYGELFLIQDPPNWNIADNVIDRENFIIVGSIHNFSYLGGLLGLIAGVIYSVRSRKKHNN